MRNETTKKENEMTTLQKMKEATEINDHNGAVLLMADMLKNKSSPCMSTRDT